jgi:hypothetical protein
MEELVNGGSRTPKSSIEEKIQHALTDARVVLPGAQALLGFRLVGVLLGGFESLPTSSQRIHIASLILVTLSTILLMMPDHRLVEHGEPSEHFFRLIKNAVLCSMIPLAVGISGDFYIIAEKISQSSLFAKSTTSLLLATFFVLWFGFGLIRKQSDAGSS